MSQSSGTGSTPAPLPGPIRAFSLAAMLFGALVSFGAVRDAAAAANASTATMPELDLGFARGLVRDEAVLLESVREAFRAQMRTLEGMRGSRMVILAILSTAASVVCVAGARIRWPSGPRRLAMARILAQSALVAAVARTLDGAQSLIVARAGVVAALRRMSTAEAEAAADIQMALVTGGSLALTATIIAGFLLLRRAAGSERLTAALEAIDRADDLDARR